jgi:hypothetical protein
MPEFDTNWTPGTELLAGEVVSGGESRDHGKTFGLFLSRYTTEWVILINCPWKRFSPIAFRKPIMLRTFPILILIVMFLVGCSRKEFVPTVAVHQNQVATEPVIPQPVSLDDDTLPPPRVVPPRSPDEALAAGVAFLLGEQSPDGAWRSDVYATFKDGLALTPLVVGALQDAESVGVEPVGAAAARHKGIEFLAKLAKANGAIDAGSDGIDYPVYTAAITVKILSHADGKDFRPARDAWLKYLKERQLTAKLGWKEGEKQYGGWGYCRAIPKKPDPNTFAPPLIESNLSATVFALEALKVAGELDPETAKAAAVFVRRRQNWPMHSPDVPLPWAQVLDGGFHFIYDDPVRNKAGLVAKDGPDWPQLFNSYGSTTADGLRALDICGVQDDLGRKAAARAWLARNFRADTHPGNYVKAHEPNREAVYYYYAAAVSKVMRDHNIKTANGTDWSTALAAELAGRQHRDGSWMNRVELVRENEPLVATSNAVSALARCKK